jgi:hypothetical protein
VARLHGGGHRLHQAGIAIEVREALAQVDAPFSAASADITVKMVVPTLGSLAAGKGVSVMLSQWQGSDERIIRPARTG